jgi:2-polyprenyl-6-methoxyphenol hydroxylase-like FAD-dependent oxidoreductase
MKHSTKVGIIGAGPAGLTLALLLQKKESIVSFLKTEVAYM